MSGDIKITGHETIGTHPFSLTLWIRNIFFKMLSRLEYGQIIIEDQGNQWKFGKEYQLSARIIINDPAAYRKIVFGGSIGAGEAYVNGLWDADDLTNLVQIMARNMFLVDKMEQGFAWLLRPVDFIQHFLNGNSKRKAKQNILAHYDLGNELYEAFLDHTLLYSSAIYPTAESSLEEAQQHKLAVLCDRLDLKPGDSVLEIGTGWGGFALYAAEHYDCHITTTTISDAQYEEASRRVADAGLENRVTLLQQDYRDLTGQYDKLVSVEMIEAVGHRFLPGFFKKCGELLRPGGTMVLQAITIRDQKYNQYRRGVDFIQRYVFPGGCLPSISRMVELLATETDMVVRKIDDFGHDYARTLEDWLQRFRETYPELRKKGYDETFKRLWEFYLCYCRGGFLEQTISVAHVVATRP
ncbi:SAM-dependent methyltransferase [Desulfogranum japonicum]|uniref:SAM-dependent methyltransferase n=1 Tax=Desulfogranum japonicum TaxID=231447 RepID=UPI0004145D99|nr:cyclopropane-fatty-acyl-phospholipid synthase family protein [Desulfogranum japonicum]